jgi:PAP2 superfamily
MAAVIVVFVVWFAAIALLGLLAVAAASRVSSPRWLRGLRRRSAQAIDASIAAVGRVATAVAVALAMWSAVIILGWLLGIAAHHLEDSIDRPAFHWWQRRQVGGTWSDVWWKLTDVGAPRVTLGLAIGGALLTAALYARRPFWWAPAVTLIVGYIAEKYSQTILKLVVHRGHPPTTMGTWPSGGMARLIVVYGLIIYFVVRRFWPNVPRMWTVAWALLALCASVQAYARLNNLEHWTTDVVGGAIYGLLLLAMMIFAYSALTRVQPLPAPASMPASPPLPRERVP